MNQSATRWRSRKISVWIWAWIIWTCQMHLALDRLKVIWRRLRECNVSKIEMLLKIVDHPNPRNSRRDTMIKTKKTIPLKSSKNKMAADRKPNSVDSSSVEINRKGFKWQPSRICRAQNYLKIHRTTLNKTRTWLMKKIKLWKEQLKKSKSKIKRLIRRTPSTLKMTLKMI